MIRLQTEPFEPGGLLTAFCQGRTETGAVVSFTGIARGEAGTVSTLELEAYEGFTEMEIARVAEEIGGRFTLHDLLIVHRIGPIGPGEAIVFVATAAAHRREAFEAADCLMDYLKKPGAVLEEGAGSFRRALDRTDRQGPRGRGALGLEPLAPLAARG